MAEAYYYFAGQIARSGNNKNKTDYTGNTVGTPRSRRRSTRCRATRCSGTRATGSPYNSPVISGSCGQNYIIYISNGAVQDNTSDTHDRRLG